MKASTPLLRRLAVVASIGLALASTVQATTVTPPTFPQLVAQAQVIIEARVQALRCEQTTRGAGHPVIHTYVAVEVTKVLKGTAPSTMELRFLGGTVGDVTMEVSGVPKFVPGQRALLFVENNGTQFCPLVGVMHGRYHLVRRPGDGVEVVHRDNGTPLRSLADIGRPATEPGAGPAAAGATTGALTLGELESSIQTELTDARDR